MKTQIIFSILAVLVYLSANSATISISKKNSNDPTDVCNNSIYYYVTTISGAPSGYKVSWIVGKGNAEEQSISEAKVKWTATSDADGYIGTIKAQLKNSSGTVLATSNTITVTIKSILHLEPNLTPYTNGNTYTIPPCSSGQVSLEVTKLNIPGTGTLNPDKVYYYMWTLPAGWSANGITSTGSNEISGGSYITASYPASSTGGAIKVKGYQAINGCDATVQSSKYATATIDRNVTLTLSANKTYFLCGDTNPITYTVTANPALPCAVYFWNNSPDATTSNTFQKVPGLSDEIVTVKVVYGDKEVVKSKKVEVKSFEGNPPPITGPGTICGGEEEYYVNGLRPGYILEWNCSGVLEKLSSFGNSAFFRGTGFGAGNIEATVKTPCGDNIPLIKRDIWVGVPGAPVTFQVSPLYENINTIFSVHIYDSPGADPASAVWETYGCVSLHGPGSGSNASFYSCPNDGCGVIYVRTSNVCGSMYNTALTVITGSGGDCDELPEFTDPVVFVISPNPATGETTLTIETSSAEKAFDETARWDLEIFSETQVLKTRQTGLRGRNAKIQTAGWQEGIYLVRVNYKGEILTGKLLVKK
jgi:hypothetical protein